MPHSLQEINNYQSQASGTNDRGDQQASSNIQDQNLQFTNSTPDEQELHTIIKNMRSNASPGPDGPNAAFFKVAWPYLAKDTTQLVTNFYSIAILQPPLNHMFITLIPKKNTTGGTSRF